MEILNYFSKLNSGGFVRSFKWAFNCVRCTMSLHFNFNNNHSQFFGNHLKWKLSRVWFCFSQTKQMHTSNISESFWHLHKISCLFVLPIILLEKGQFSKHITDILFFRKHHLFLFSNCYYFFYIRHKCLIPRPSSSTLKANIQSPRCPQSWLAWRHNTFTSPNDTVEADSGQACRHFGHNIY